MKLFREAIIIFGIYFLGEGIKSWMNVPIPGNLIGMMILFFLLNLRVVKVQQISTISDFLLGHMPFFFIPAGVALMTSFSLISRIWVKLIVICFITTFFTMGFTGWSIQKMMKRKGGNVNDLDG